jgi:hypothetical protein
MKEVNPTQSSFSLSLFLSLSYLSLFSFSLSLSPSLKAYAFSWLTMHLLSLSCIADSSLLGYRGRPLLFAVRGRRKSYRISIVLPPACSVFTRRLCCTWSKLCVRVRLFNLKVDFAKVNFGQILGCISFARVYFLEITRFCRN